MSRLLSPSCNRLQQLEVNWTPCIKRWHRQWQLKFGNVGRGRIAQHDTGDGNRIPLFDGGRDVSFDRITRADIAAVLTDGDITLQPIILGLGIFFLRAIAVEIETKRTQRIGATRTNDTDGLPRTAGYNATHVDLAAPGEGVLTTYLDNRYDVIGGNSFAAPLVAGSAALLYSIPQDSLCKLSKKQPLAALNIVKDAILRGVDIIPAVQGKTVTGGRLNIAKSFNRLRLLKGMPIGNLAITKVYPNPAQSQVNFGLRLPEAYQNITITISNTLGEIISERKIGNRDLFSEYIQLDTALYPSGIYLISLTSELFKISKKFVVAHR